jgi:hypothetical protein
MGKFHIDQPHKLPLAELKGRMDVLANTMRAKWNLNYSWVSFHELEVERTGMSGRFILGDDKVSADVDLKFYVEPYRRAIEDGVRAELARVVQKPETET